MNKYLKASEIASKVFKLKLPSPTYANNAITSFDSMAMGTFYEKQIIDYVSKYLNMKVYYKTNKKNISKYLFTLNGIDYYITGRADGLLYASYSDGTYLYRYEYILEVKNMVSYSISDFNNEIPEYYMPQVRSYIYLYHLPVLFVAQCYDGYIIKTQQLKEEEIKSFINDLYNILSLNFHAAVDT